MHLKPTLDAVHFVRGGLMHPTSARRWTYNPVMSPQPHATTLNLPRVIFVGLIVPILLALIDRWLLSREFSSRRDVAAFQAMAAFVIQVGLLGVLCARLIQPPWLRWVIYAWCLLFTDLNAMSSLVPELSQSLYTAQLGLVTVWAVLGTARWKIRLPVILLLVIPSLANIAQTAALCLICFVLRSQRFRLAFVAPADDAPANQGAGHASRRPIQFGVGDMLLWTTALAPLLAIVRLQEGRILTEGVLHAIVLVVALWAALGRRPGLAPLAAAGAVCITGGTDLGAGGMVVHVGFLESAMAESIVEREPSARHLV